MTKAQSKMKYSDRLLASLIVKKKLSKNTRLRNRFDGLEFNNFLSSSFFTWFNLGLLLSLMKTVSNVDQASSEGILLIVGADNTPDRKG